MKSLLQAYPLNSKLTLKNRIVMAPMTRSKADDQLVPTQAMADYYERRAEAGLIVTEGVIIRSDGLGYPNVPGIYTEAQIAGWRRVTEAVHRQGGRIFAQIWHVGRVTHPMYLNGAFPIAPSAVEIQGRVPRGNGLMYGMPRELALAEIKELINDYAQAAKNAIKAGFDGVEIHGANGYLIDQFLHHHTNRRTDEYGGSIENRVRFALEVVKACGEAIGFERVGIRLSPAAYLNDIHADLRDASVFSYLLTELNALSIAYVHTGNFNDSVQYAELNNKRMTEFLRCHFNGTVIASGGYDHVTAQQGIETGQFDMVAIGRPFIANPDYISRISQGQSLQSYDAAMLETLY